MLRPRTVLFVILAAAAAVLAPGAEAAGAERSAAVRDLEAGTAVRGLSLDRVSGVVRRAAFDPAPAKSLAPGADVAERAEAFLLRHGAAFGIDRPAAELSPMPAVVDRLGHTRLAYRQVHGGVPVFGGRLALHFDADGGLVMAGSTVVPGVGVERTTPAVSEADAIRRGRVVVAKQHGLAPELLAVDSVELVVFNDGAIWGRAGEDHLAWVLELGDGLGVREQLFVDAVDGRVLEQISHNEGIFRSIYEYSTSNRVWNEGDPLPYQGSGPDRDVEINNLIDVAGHTYTTFANLSAGDFLSWTGTDSPMRSYYDRTGMTCPNAYFNGSSTSFCVGTATDDVVAHEWAHGYTQETHGLIYAWQPGALNEAYSDIFGEVVDLLYDSGSDTPSTVRESEACSAATGADLPELIVESPPELAGQLAVQSGTFNPAPPWSVTAPVAVADDGIGLGNDACDPLVDFPAGSIALISMSACSPDRFVTPVQNAEAAGAVGVIVVNPLNDNLISMTGPSGQTGIPAVFLGRSDGDAIRAAPPGGVTVTMRSNADGSLRWLVAEDSGAFGGAIRDMWNPECLGDPGRVTSPRYHCAESDNGGVHVNSGVPNRAFALLVDGGAANGVSVAPIGLTRAAHVYWRAMSVYQLPLSDFRDHVEALEASCSDLVGAPLPDLLTGGASGEVITPLHCAEIGNAMLATEMATWPSQCEFETILDPDPPLRPEPIEVFAESFDSDPGTWTVSNAGVYSEYQARDWTWTEDVPDGGDGAAFFAISDPHLGNCRPGSDDQSGVMYLDSPAVELPRAARPVLVFDHYVATEASFDGGNLRVSVNGGPFELVPGEAFLFNPYNGELSSSASSHNPMSGEPAFHGTNATTHRGSWGQSQVDLGAFARGGDTLVVRFAFGTDGCNGMDGWYVDTVRLLMTPSTRTGGTRVATGP
ncbi:MAG TPA: M4 family metallopeptidase [Candidatus Sulfomarinibacteraceae bacterium]|nr:M4 family metallopeptidase [Candidatus Sulfomarinibacteraceae bacterium]